MDQSANSAGSQINGLLRLLPAITPPDAAPILSVNLLGGFKITLGGRSLETSDWRLRKAQSLVKLLLLAPGHRMHREGALDLLWPELNLDAAANNLHYTMHVARSTLAQLWSPIPSDARARPGRLLLLRQQMLSLDPMAPLWIDVEAFEAAAASARQGTNPRLYEDALSLYGGDLLPDDLYEDWASSRRGALRTTYQALLLAVANLYSSSGNYPEAIAAFQRVVAAEPTHEEVNCQLMRLYALSGQRHLALRQYELLRAALQREMQMLPSPESRRLYDEIVSGRLMAVSSSPPAPTVPTVPSATHQLWREEPGTTKDSTPLAPGFGVAAHNRPALPSTTPMLIGRYVALERCRAVWAAASSEPQALLIAGEAGIGKSRVAEEALSRAAHNPQDAVEPIQTAQARCYLAEGVLPLEPVVSWLRSSELWPGVLALDPVWQSEIARVLPEIMIERPQLPPPIALPDNLQRTRLFEALARAVTQSGKPLLLVIDDMQWCEPETLAWLRYLLRQRIGAPLLVMGTVRSEEITPEHPLLPWMADLRHSGQLTEIELGPLDAAETAALGAQVAGRPLDAEQAKRLYAEAEGHPLFVVEVVRADLINTAAGHLNASGNANSGMSRLPPTMVEVLERRLRQLSPQAHELASLAAVVGREFSVELLMEAHRPTGRDEESALRALEELRQRRIVREQGAGSYDFSHDKFREVAYAAQSDARRRALHRRVARALEVVAADPLDEAAPQLALHYERGGETVKAVAALERAGRLALRRGLLVPAREYLQRAIALAPESDQMRLYEELGDFTWMAAAGAYSSYGAALRRWRRHAPKDPLIGARLLRKMLYVWLRTDVVPPPDPEELTAMASEAQALAERAGDEDELQRVCVARLCLSWRQKALKSHEEAADDVRSGWANVLTAVERLATSGDWDGYQGALDVYSSCLLYVGAQAEALELVQMRLRAPQISPHEYGDAVHMLAWTHFARGDYEQSMAAIRADWEQSTSDLPLWMGGSWFGAWSAWFSGDWGALAEMLQVSDRAWEQSGYDLHLSLASYWAALHIGLAREDRAMVDAAISKLRELVDWITKQADLPQFGALLDAYRADDVEPIVRGDQQGNVDPGIEVLRLIFFNERSEPAPGFVYSGAVHAAEEHFYDCARPIVQVADALLASDSELLETAIVELEAHKLIPHAARMRIVLAQRTGDRAHLERARLVLERLGDRQFLRRLEAVDAALR